MAAPSAIDPAVQKGAMDCAVAALAMLSGQPYRVVSEAALAVSPVVHRSGLWTTQIRRIAENIGFPLAVRRGVDPENTGLLLIKRGKKGVEHAVVLFQGVVIDPANGMVWDYDTFLEQGQWRAIGFLEPVE